MLDQKLEQRASPGEPPAKELSMPKETNSVMSKVKVVSPAKELSMTKETNSVM